VTFEDEVRGTVLFSSREWSDEPYTPMFDITENKTENGEAV